MKRYIALADCDSFFVSAERAINPKLNNKPVVVLSGNDGCIISRSNEAKKLGIKMGEPYFMAKGKYKDMIYVRANHRLYQHISNQVMNTLKIFTPEVEVCSIDGAYIDLTGLKTLYKTNYINIAKMIRKKVLTEVKVPISLGISCTKTLAKLASDKAKTTGGIYAIGNAKLNKVLIQTKIEEISGIGKQSSLKMKQACIITVNDFIARPDGWIKSNFGVHGIDLKTELQGVSLYKVNPYSRPPQSISDTKSLKNFTQDINILKQELCQHIQNVCKKARLYNAKANIIEVMVKTKDFKVYKLKHKLNYASNQENDIIPSAINLLEELYKPFVEWRSIGISLLSLSYTSQEQLDLFTSSTSQSPKINPKLGKAIDLLENKFGENIIKFNLKN